MNRITWVDFFVSLVLREDAKGNRETAEATGLVPKMPLQSKERLRRQLRLRCTARDHTLLKGTVRTRKVQESARLEMIDSTRRARSSVGRAMPF